MIELVLNNKTVLIHEEDLPKVKEYRWYVGKYVYASLNKKTIYLHRILLNPPVGMDIDHINHNPYDNRKENLRIANRSQNNMNRRRAKNTRSKYKGVILDRGKWRAQLAMNKKFINLGRFTSEEEAARTYDKKAKELFGEFAKLNFN